MMEESELRPREEDGWESPNYEYMSLLSDDWYHLSCLLVSKNVVYIIRDQFLAVKDVKPEQERYYHSC